MVLVDFSTLQIVFSKANAPATWSSVMIRNHRRGQGGPKGTWSPKFLENIVILCVERRFSKQNSVIHRKSNILAPQFFFPQNFRAGYATVRNAREYLAQAGSPTITTEVFPENERDGTWLSKFHCKRVLSTTRPITSLPRSRGQRVFWEEPKLFQLCPIVSNRLF